MRNRLFSILLLAIVLGLVLVVLQHGAPLIDRMEEADFTSVVINGTLAVFVGASIFVLFREQFARAIQALLIWGAIALALVLGYTYRFELREIGDRMMSELAPGWTANKGRIVEVARSRAGDFSVNAQVNGARVSMVLDSGASAVVLTQEAARAAGLPLEVLNYTANVETANGRTRVAPVTLDRLAVGNIVERSVPALIAQPGQLKSNLLGMSFLNRLESWEVRGDKLQMRAYP